MARYRQRSFFSSLFRSSCCADCKQEPLLELHSEQLSYPLRGCAGSGLLNLPALFVLTHLQVFCSTWRVPVCAERPDLQTNGQQLASSFSRTTTTANAEQVEVGILSHVYCTRASSRSPILTVSAQGRGQRPAALCRPKSFARVLNTKGWQPSIQAQLKVGEYCKSASGCTW